MQYLLVDENTRRTNMLFDKLHFSSHNTVFKEKTYVRVSELSSDQKSVSHNKRVCILYSVGIDCW